MNKIIILLIMISFSMLSKAQEERKIIRQGNNAYKSDKYTEAEELYRKALVKKPQSLEANYNVGNVLYKQNKYLDAASKYSSLTNSTQDKREQAYIYHNLGNSYLKANKLDESIKAYKESLRLNPSDKETKFNLAYAQRKMIQQQQQQQQQNKDDKNKKDNKKQDQQNKDQQNKDQQDKKDQNKKDDQQKQKQDQQQDKNISQEDANRILEAMQNEEKELQKKLKMEKVQKEKGKTLKNW